MKLLNNIWKAIVAFFSSETPACNVPATDNTYVAPKPEAKVKPLYPDVAAPLPPIPPVNPPKKASKRIDITSDTESKPKRKRYHNKKKKGNPDTL